LAVGDEKQPMERIRYDRKPGDRKSGSFTAGKGGSSVGWTVSFRTDAGWGRFLFGCKRNGWEIIHFSHKNAIKIEDISAKKSVTSGGVVVQR
jgi:hypothetical protein